MAMNTKNLGKRFVKPEAAPAAPEAAVVNDIPASEPEAFSNTELEAESAPESESAPAYEPEAFPILLELEAEPSPEPESFSYAVPAISSQGTTGVGIEPSVATLPLKVFDLWNENTNACLDFAKAFRQAKSPAEMLELQSKFANERFDAFVRQSGELTELIQKATKDASAVLPSVKLTLFAA